MFQIVDMVDVEKLMPLRLRMIKRALIIMMWEKKETPFQIENYQGIDMEIRCPNLTRKGLTHN